MSSRKGKATDKPEITWSEWLALETDYKIVHIIGGRKWPDKFVRDWLKERRKRQ